MLPLLPPMLRPSARALLSQQGWQVGPAVFDTAVVAEHSFVRCFVAAHSPQGAELGEGLVATAAINMAKDGAGEDEVRQRCEERALLRLVAKAASLASPIEQRDDSQWRPCQHTGIGVAADVQEASRQAVLSAVSAHRVLASWFGVGAVENVEVTGSDGSDWRIWTLVWPALQVDGGADAQPVTTVGRVLEPMRDDKVLIRGFGGGATLDEAQQACAAAVADELAFLGLELPLRPGQLKQGLMRKGPPGRRFYRERAMHPAGAGAIMSWVKELQGLEADGSVGTLRVRCTTLGPCLGPCLGQSPSQSPSPELVVVRAEGITGSLLPVVHGRGYAPDLYEGQGRRDPTDGQRLLEGFHPWF